MSRLENAVLTWTFRNVGIKSANCCNLYLVQTTPISQIGAFKSADNFNFQDLSWVNKRYPCTVPKDDSSQDQFLKVVLNLQIIFEFSAVACTDLQAKKVEITKTMGDLVISKTKLGSSLDKENFLGWLKGVQRHSVAYQKKFWLFSSTFIDPEFI